jgi:hypothetical protein
LQDTHTLDLSEFDGVHANITLLRLVDPGDDTVQVTVNSWTEKELYDARKFRVTADTVPVSIGQA